MDVKKLGISIGACLGAGGLGSWFTARSLATWYPTLVKPSFTPPNWLFGPVWTTLYFLMGIAMYLVWIRAKPDKLNKPAALFGLQLALNVGWSFVFFRLNSTLGGLFVIVGLWLSILLTIKEFKLFSKKAAWLMVPYLLWVSYAAILNYSIWKLNK